MSATSSPSDKLLFLFTTDSDDLSLIRTAFQDYYKVSSANTFESSGCPNFVSSYKSVIEALRGTDPVPGNNVFKTPDPAGKTPAGEPSSLSLVVVISGNANSSGLIDNGSNTLSWGTIRQTIFGTIPNPVPRTYDYQVNTEVQVVFVTPFCSSFLTECDTNGMPVVYKGTIVTAPTVTDQIDQTGREAFLNQYANELMLYGSTPTDNYGRLSFNDIAATLGVADANHFRLIPAATTEKYYPGCAFLGINDGSPDWWESPDIYINDPGNDLYDVGVVNTVYVNVHISGAHPVDNFWIGTKHFGSGLGSSDALRVEQIIAGSLIMPDVLTPGDDCLYSYDQLFESTTVHRCIVARAKFAAIISTDIDDSSEWSIQANPDEAQRNVDPASASPSPTQPPKPDEGNNPDPDPEPGEEDENNTGDRSLRNLRGFKEHIYSILNPFREKRRFRLVLRDEFQKNAENIKFSFHQLREGRVTGQYKLTTKPYTYIPFTIEGGQKIEFMMYLAVKPKLKLKKDFRLPMEILVENKAKRTLNVRKSAFTRLDKAFVPIGGLTLKVAQQAFNIKGFVFDRKGKPVSQAKIKISTVNGRQSAILKTDKKGAYTIAGINADAYRISAETKDWYTKSKIVNLFSRDLNIDLREGN